MMNKQIDQKDKKILKTLFEDSRATIAEIATKTGIRRDSVSRRLNRLRKDKIITGFIPLVDPAALGYPNVAILLFKLKTRNDADKKKFLKQLVSNKFVFRISKLIGKYDFQCSIAYENTTHLDSIVEEIKTYIPNIVDEFELYQVVDNPKTERIDDLI